MKNENPKARIDSGHFIKSAVLARRLVQDMPNGKFGDIVASFRKGIFDIKADSYVETGEGVPFVRIADLTDGLLDEEKTAWISHEAHRAERKTALRQGGVVLSKTAYPAASLVTLSECNVSQDIIAVRLSHNGHKRFKPAYIVAFMNSRVGMTLLWSEFQGNVQQHLSLDDAKKLRIPELGLNLQNRVQDLFREAIARRRAAVDHIRNAERKLLAALGLADWRPPEPLTYTRPVADVLAAGRLDAQYFMPAKQHVQRALSVMPGLPLGQRFHSIRDLFDPRSESPHAMVRNYDVTDALAPVLDDEKQPSNIEDILSVKKRFQFGDVAISRLRAYLRQIAVVRTSSDIPAVGSSEFIVLQPVESSAACIAPETLMTFLRSAPVQTVLKWCQDGSQHPRFSERDLLSIHIPDEVARASPQIERIIEESFAARRRARELLGRAKHAVEIAIEDSEAVA